MRAKDKAPKERKLELERVEEELGIKKGRDGKILYRQGSEGRRKKGV